MTELDRIVTIICNNMAYVSRIVHMIVLIKKWSGEVGLFVCFLTNVIWPNVKNES